MITVSESVTFKCVALVKPLGSFLLFALSHVCKVSFVCSLTLMHEFRGSLWFLFFFALLLVVSSLFFHPLEEPVICEHCVCGWFPELVVKLLV
jgi:hypothetical protein